MKREIILILFVLMSMAATAQYTQSEYAGKPIDIRGSRVFVEKQQLGLNSAVHCFASLDGADCSSDYLKYRAGYRTGLGLTVGGASLAAAGFVTFFTGFLVALPHAFAGEESIGADIALYGGFVSMIAGSACFVAGIPTLCVYKTRLNRLEKQYNTSLRLGASPAGLSMSLCF
jgi:hypothetical protein